MTENNGNSNEPFDPVGAKPGEIHVGRHEGPREMSGTVTSTDGPSELDSVLKWGGAISRINVGARPGTLRTSMRNFMKQLEEKDRPDIMLKKTLKTLGKPHKDMCTGYEGIEAAIMGIATDIMQADGMDERRPLRDVIATVQALKTSVAETDERLGQLAETLPDDDKNKQIFTEATTLVRKVNAAAAVSGLWSSLAVEQRKVIGRIAD